MIRQLVKMGALLLVMTYAQHQEVLAQSSVTSFFMETTPSSRRPALFIRRDPVVYATSGFDTEMLRHLKEALTLYGKATNLTVSGSDQGGNLILIRGKEIIQSGSLNMDALERGGISSSVISLMTQRTGWTSGCVPYAFPNSTGSIALFVGLIDANLNQHQQNVCLAQLVARAFGIGLGDQKDLPETPNVFKNAFALSVVSSCDRQNSPFSISDVKSCIESEFRLLPFRK